MEINNNQRINRWNNYYLIMRGQVILKNKYLKCIIRYMFFFLFCAGDNHYYLLNKYFIQKYLMSIVYNYNIYLLIKNIFKRKYITDWYHINELHSFNTPSIFKWSISDQSLFLISNGITKHLIWFYLLRLQEKMVRLLKLGAILKKCLFKNNIRFLVVFYFLSRVAIHLIFVWGTSDSERYRSNCVNRE